MKHAKKLIGLLLTLALVLSISVTAFAAGGGNTITVTNAQGGETYTIYKMLNLEVNEDKTAYAYTVNEKWTNFFTDSGEGTAYVTIDDLGYVTWNDDKKGTDDMIAFGKAAAAYAEDTTNSVSEVSSQTPVADGDITFDNLAPGYYLITSTNGTKVIVDTTPTNPNPSIAEKNTNPTIDKTVEEDSGNKYGDVNDAQIGQTVNFKTVVYAKSGAKNYVVHDAMSDGLDFDDQSVVVAVGGNNLTAKSESGDASTPYSDVNQNGYQYEVVTTGLDNDCDFHIVFVQAYLDTITVDTDITITYSATLNNQAVIAGDGNTNKTKLDWGDKNKTEWDTTTTYTWESDVLKYGNGDETNVLEGAQFVLLNPDKDKVAKFDANGKITEWVNLPEVGTDGKIALTSWDSESIQTTDKDGKISIQGLNSNVTYYLREVKAPEGYNLLGEDQEVQITASENAGNHTMTQTALTTKVNNQSGNELPSTGGIGTTIFYVVGSILLVGAAVLLIVKKRMSIENKRIL